MAKKAKAIVIPFAHLSPVLRTQIGTPLPKTIRQLGRQLMGSDYLGATRETLRKSNLASRNFNNDFDTHTIRGARFTRALAEGWFTLYLPATIFFSPLFGLHTFAVSAGRFYSARAVRYIYEQLQQDIKKSKLVIDPKFSKEYSIHQISSELLRKTHPVFIVKGSGDLVFLPMTRIEYARYVFQQRRLAKLGVQPWTWRGFLERPSPLKSWRTYAAEKVSEWKEKVRLKPTIKPVEVPIRPITRPLPRPFRRSFRK